MQRNNETKYVLLIFVAIAFLATGGIFVKLSAFPPIATGFYRILFSIPLLLPFVWKETQRTRKQASGKKDVRLMLVAGIFLAFDLILWNTSFHLTTVANGNLLANLVPLTIIPVSYFVFKESISREFFIGAAVTFLGVFILMAGKIHPSPQNFLGDFLAFTTSIFYALFLLTVYKVRDRVNAMVIMFVSAFGSVAVLLIAMLWLEGVFIPKTFMEFYPLIGLALVSQIMGQGLLSFTLGKVRANLSSLIVLSQPVIAAVYSFFIFGEKLSSIEMLGIAVVLGGIYLAKKSG